MDSKYKQLIDQAANEFAVAKAAYSEQAQAAARARDELATLEGEAQALKGRVEEFEKGALDLDMDSYVDIETRRKYLDIRGRQLATVVKNESERLQGATTALQGVSSKWRRRLADQLRLDMAELEKELRAELDKVLK